MLFAKNVPWGDCLVSRCMKSKRLCIRRNLLYFLRFSYNIQSLDFQNNRARIERVVVVLRLRWLSEELVLGVQLIALTDKIQKYDDGEQRKNRVPNGKITFRCTSTCVGISSFWVQRYNYQGMETPTTNTKRVGALKR